MEEGSYKALNVITHLFFAADFLTAFPTVAVLPWNVCIFTDQLAKPP